MEKSRGTLPTEQWTRDLRVCGTLERIAVWSMITIGLNMMGFAQEQSVATPPSALIQLVVGPSTGNPYEENATDKETFADVTAPMAAAAPNGNLVIQSVVKIQQYKVYTGNFVWDINSNRLDQETTLVSPDAREMLVKVILDLYPDNNQKGASDLPAKVLWIKDIQFLGGNGTSYSLVSMVRRASKSVVEVVFNGLSVSKHGDRIAIILLGEDGDPSQLHLWIKDKDYGTLESLKPPSSPK